MAVTKFEKRNITTSHILPDPSSNRRTPRRTYERLIGVLVSGKYELFRSNEISEGGMSLNLPPKFSRGQLILLTFILPYTLETVVGRAEIVYQNEKSKDALVRTGIKFLNLDTLKRRAIRDFVSSKPPSDKILAG